jgi:hypothetical protein
METGWGKLSVRREKRKLSLFYDIVSGQSPDYLQDLLPILAILIPVEKYNGGLSGMS